MSSRHRYTTKKALIRFLFVPIRRISPNLFFVPFLVQHKLVSTCTVVYIIVMIFNEILFWSLHLSQCSSVQCAAERYASWHSVYIEWRLSSQYFSLFRRNSNDKPPYCEGLVSMSPEEPQWANVLSPSVAPPAILTPSSPSRQGERCVKEPRLLSEYSSRICSVQKDTQRPLEWVNLDSDATDVPATPTRQRAVSPQRVNREITSPFYIFCPAMMPQWPLAAQ